MARAHEHLASARYAEAAGAFRAVLRIDPNEFQAHFGLADALVARGQRAEAVEGLVAAAESCTAREDNGAALTLYGKALAVDPSRLELHLDVAMAEAALGRMESAQQRLEHLAEVYMQAGRTDEAAEVYRCLAGWEGDGEDELEAEPEPQPQPAARTTQVPTTRGRTAPHAAIPTMMPTTETVVISTILVTPDGQLLQMPLEHAPGQPLDSGDSVPPLSAELLEVVHSAPIDLAAGEEIEDVERTVVAFPPPPPTLPEESAVHNVNRAALEAAVVAAMDNLAQLEEEDMTLIMQRLPPQPKSGRVRSSTGESRLPEFVTRGRMVKPELPKPEPEPEVPEDLEVDDDLAAEELAAPVEEPAPESKLRIKPAPRPVGKAAEPAPVAAKSVAAPGKVSAGRPAAGKPAAGAPASRAGVVGKASAPIGASKAAAPPSKPAAPSKAAAAPVSKAGAPSKPAAATASRAGVASKPVAAPASKSAPASQASRPAPASQASKPVGTAKPAPASTPSKPVASAGKPAASAGKPAPDKVPAPPLGGSKLPAMPPAARPSPTPPPGGATAAPAKPTRPDNPLAERLRRRAGLQKPAAVPGGPAPTEPRPTEPIAVRSPSRLPPVTKTKK